MTASSTQSPFQTLGLRKELADAVAALGYEEPTPVQRETIPLLLEGRDLLGRPRPAPARPRRSRCRCCSGSARRRRRRGRPAASCSCRRASWRCRSPRRSTSTRKGVGLHGAAALRRRADAPADSRPRARRAHRRRHAGPRAGSHPPRDAAARRAARAGPRRGRRDARHGVRRGSRRDPEGDARDAADGALLGDDAGADSGDCRTAPEEPGARDDRPREAGRRQDAARPAGRLHRGPRAQAGGARAHPRHGGSGRHAGVLPDAAGSGVAGRDVQRAWPSQPRRCTAAWSSGSATA